MQKLRVNSMQQRRKWSDWSECSADCLRTRHRLNCDDILAAQNSTQADNRPNADRARKLRNSREELEEELLAKIDQAEDDDYADEGDEEDENDSCANVDTTKTFEQSACIGGLCRLSTNQTAARTPANFPASSSSKPRIQPKSRQSPRGESAGAREIDSMRLKLVQKEQQQPQQPLAPPLL